MAIQFSIIMDVTGVFLALLLFSSDMRGDVDSKGLAMDEPYHIFEYEKETASLTNNRAVKFDLGTKQEDSSNKVLYFNDEPTYYENENSKEHHSFDQVKKFHEKWIPLKSLEKIREAHLRAVEHFAGSLSEDNDYGHLRL